MKKIGKFISSMPFAIMLLILLASACAVSSAIPQGQTYAQYALQYGERAAGWILGLRLDDAFHSWWFIGLSACLCLNLLCCNLIRLPALLKRIRTFADPEKNAASKPSVQAKGTGDPQKVFAALRMRKPAEYKTGEGREILFSAANTAGFWGAWVCHLGILFLILGFALGQMTMKQYTVYGLPGQTKEMDNSGLWVTIDDLQISLDEGESVLQYTSVLTVSDPQKSIAEQGRASVNAPASLFGYKFFQNSVGWGATVHVLKDGKELQTEQLCAGEFFAVEGKPELVINFPAFYPDYVQGADNSALSVTAEPKNPAYLYQVYYQGQILGMNVLKSGEELTIDEYTVLFENPRNYTLLAVKQDHFTWLVLLGGLITLAGLVLAFWLQPCAVWAIREEDGWMVCGQNRKGGVLFRDEFREAAAAAGVNPDRDGEKTGKGEND